MPKCVQCGKEADRDVMCGYKDDLRCPDCVRKLQPIYDRSYGRAEAPPPPRVTYAILGLSIVASLAFWARFTNPDVLTFLDRYFLPNGRVWDGQLWRLVLAAFFHADPLHLLLNFFFTLRFG